MTRLLLAMAVFLTAPAAGAADKRYDVTGMVLKVDASSRSFVVSHGSIPGLMDAMTMPFEVRDAGELRGLVPGAAVEFLLVVDGPSAYATRIRVRRYESVEQDPLTAQRLALMRRIAGVQPKPLTVGAQVPEFTLVDQARQRVALSDLRGKVVAVSFVYTRCALPQFCLRATNNFSVLQRRFRQQLGLDLVLLTVTFDPQRDQPEVLAAYANQWNADPKTWHFLTGAVADVRRVCGLFGVDYFPDEGLMNHSLRTAVIDRTGKLVANLEGNQFTPEQVGDLVQAVLHQ